MIVNSKKQTGYKTELIFLSIMTLLSSFACTLLGYLFLPFAAGFYAALLAIENKNGRVFSLIIPLVMFVANIFLNGFYSLEAIAYVIIGLIIYAGFNKTKSKASVAFYSTAVLVVLMMLSAVLIAFDELGEFNFTAIDDFYVDLYEAIKINFVTAVTSLRITDEAGNIFQQINAGDATAIYNTFLLYLIPASVIFSFLCSGISIKIFTSRVRKQNQEDIRLSDWRFRTTPFVAYFYLAAALLSFFITDGIFGISLAFISSVLMVIYLYIGAYVIYDNIAARKGSSFAIILFAIAFILFPSFLPRLVSFVGIYINNIIYKNEQKPDITV